MPKGIDVEGFPELMYFAKGETNKFKIYRGKFKKKNVLKYMKKKLGDDWKEPPTEETTDL